MYQAASEIHTIVENLRAAVRQSEGWWRRISAESGCQYHCLKRLAQDPSYDPKVSDAAKVHAWFLINGVKERGPQGRVKQTVPADG